MISTPYMVSPILIINAEGVARLHIQDMLVGCHGNTSTFEKNFTQMKNSDLTYTVYRVFNATLKDCDFPND